MLVNDSGHKFDKGDNLSLAQRLAQRLLGLHQLDRAILTADSLENLAQIALKHIIQIVPCFRASLSTVDLDAKKVTVLALHSEKETSTREGQTYPLDDTYLSAIANEPYAIINDLDQSPNGIIQEVYKQGIRTILLVPLRTEGKVVGLLSLHSIQPNYFTEEALQIAAEVADQVAIGIHKTILANKVTRYVQRMEILHAIDLGLIQGGSVKELVAKTLKHLQILIPCERIGVGVIQQATQEVVIYSSQFDYDSELSEGVRIPIPPNWLEGFDSEGVRLFEDIRVLDDPPFQRLVKEGFLSQLQVLMRAKGGGIGVMGCSSSKLGFFTPEHREIAKEVADQLCIALHQLMLAQAVEQHAAELELRVAERTAELQKSKDQIETILHNSLDGILLVDRDLRIQQANPAASRLLSFKLNHLELVNLLGLIQPEDAKRIKMSIEQAIEEQKTQPIEAQVTHRDGTKVDIEFTFGYILGDGLVSTIHDITARKQTEAAFKQALAEEKALVEAKQRFVSVTSHEFRTPLTVILSTAETLWYYQDRLNRDQINQKIDKIRQSVLYMTSIMDDVLQLAKIQSGNLELNSQLDDFEALCRSIIDDFESLSESQGRFVYKGSAEPLYVEFDQRLMKQAINNLLSNALKYSPVEKPVEITLTSVPRQIRLIIRDQGVGISSEDLKRLFEPFHRASNVTHIQGTGLGLSITKQIVENHGGQILVESEVGSGSQFTVCLPMSEARTS